MRPFKKLAKLKLSVEVALWPGLRLLGLGVEADIEKSVPVFSNTLIKFELALIAIRSGAVSAFKSGSVSGLPTIRTHLSDTLEGVSPRTSL